MKSREVQGHIYDVVSQGAMDGVHSLTHGQKVAGASDDVFNIKVFEFFMLGHDASHEGLSIDQISN
jgi:hypothetical protein